jgi:hypothetical protein
MVSVEIHFLGEDERILTFNILVVKILCSAERIHTLYARQVSKQLRPSYYADYIAVRVVILQDLNCCSQIQVLP